MEKNITIRPERVSDYQQVEDIIRQAFYNLYTPGCTEHYLAHAIRPHPDFLPELDLVLELDGRVVGNIMYTKSTLVDEAGKEKGILTFGPVCIRPGLQRRGYGRLLMEESFRRASAMGYEAIVRKSACPARRPLRFSAAPSFCDRSAHFFHWKYPVCLTE